MDRLYNLIAKSEDWLIRRVLHYAREYSFTKYTSTLEEAWRMSIRGLSEPLLRALQEKSPVLELSPDADFSQDPVASFGVLEAQRHRSRGITLTMFLGLMKYYRQSYIDLVQQAGFDKAYEEYSMLFVQRFFDRVEIGFVSEWAESPNKKLLDELQSTNRAMTNEMNKYLTIFESSADPVIFLNNKGSIDSMNHAAAELIYGEGVSDHSYYGAQEKKALLPWLDSEVKSFISADNMEIELERELETKKGIRYFQVKLKRMLDVSKKFSGATVILNDLTERRVAEMEVEHFASFPQLIPEPIIEIDRDGNITYCNWATLRTLKRLHCGEDVSVFIPRDIGEILKKLSSGKDRTLYREIKIKHRLFAEQIYLTKQFDTARIYAMDITHRKQAEKNLQKTKDELEKRVEERTRQLFVVNEQLRKENEVRRSVEMELSSERQRLYTVLDELPAYIYLQGPDYSIRFANRLFQERFGKPEGRMCYQVFGESNTPCTGCPIQRVIESRTPTEWEYKAPDGRFYHLYDYPFVDIDETPLVLELGIDITERKIAENALRETNELFESIFSNVHFLVAYMDTDFNFIRVNKAFAEAAGRKPEFFEGRNYFALFPHAETEATFRNVVESGEQFSALESPFIFHEHPQGDVTYWDWSIQPVKDGGGQVRGVILSLVDRTEFVRSQKHLKETELLLGLVLDALPVGVWVIDRSGRIIFGNPAGKKIWAGAKYVDLDQYGEYVAWSVDTGKRLYAQDWAAARAFSKGETTIDETLEIECFDKTRKVILNSAIPLRDEINEIIGAIVVNQDITDRKTSEEAIRLANAYNRSLIEAGLDPLVTIDPAGKINDVNHATEIVTGCSRDELIGTDFSDYFTDPARARHGYQLVFNQGSVRNYDLEIQHRDGHITPVLYNATMYKDEQGKNIGIFAAARDMTELKRMEEERTRLAAAVEQSAEGVLITDKKGFTVYVNHAFEEITGHAKEDILGRQPDVMTKESQSQWYSSMRDVLLHAKVWAGRIELMKKDGTIREVDLTVSPVKDASGAVINYVSIGRDVTSQVKLEKELRQAQKMEAIGTLAGGIAHDFNNILAGIIGFTEMSLEDVPETGPPRESLEFVLKGAHRGRDLVRQILTFSRKSEPEKKPTNLGAAIKEALPILRASIPSTIQIQLNLTDSSENVLADRIQIHQILMNLCSNAAHAMHNSGGVLEIDLERVEVIPEKLGDYQDLQPGSYMKLSISDTGRGMDRSTLERIFEPFFTTKNPGEGTGMGLSVVHGIVKGHNGEITVKSEITKGSVFEIYFPVFPEGTLINEPMIKRLPQGKERILFVDDEPDIVAISKDRLQRLGYDVVAMSNSLDALEAFRSHPDTFDLVITDYTMPRLTGVDLAKEIRRMGFNTPIILCSGNNELMAGEKSEEAGITEMVMKPLSKKEFSEVIRKVLDKTK